MDDLQLYDKLSAFISDNKRALFDRIAPQRTRHITVVLENIFQSQNASAVIRTCDLVGVQDIHVIEDRNKYQLNPDVTMGSSKWIDIHRYRNAESSTMDCVRALRAKGYCIVATSPRSEHITPESIPLDRPLALCFGTELTGLSDELLEEADMHLRIPMHGFTESYNISVSAAIVLYTLMQRLRSSDVQWQLHDEALLQLKLQWTRTMLQNPSLIEQRLRDDAR